MNVVRLSIQSFWKSVLQTFYIAFHILQRYGCWKKIQVDAKTLRQITRAPAHILKLFSIEKHEIRSGAETSSSHVLSALQCICANQTAREPYTYEPIRIILNTYMNLIRLMFMITNKQKEKRQRENATRDLIQGNQKRICNWTIAFQWCDIVNGKNNISL